MNARDIRARLSTQSASAGDDTASTPAESIGGYMSTTELADGALHNLFPAITAVQAESGITLYRCVFILNDGDWALSNVKVWLESQGAGGGDMAIGIDPVGVSARDAPTEQAATPANGTTAPSGVEFSARFGEPNALHLGDLGIDECAAVWFRLTVPPGAVAMASDNAMFRVSGYLFGSSGGS